MWRDPEAAASHAPGEALSQEVKSQTGSRVEGIGLRRRLCDRMRMKSICLLLFPVLAAAALAATPPAAKNPAREANSTRKAGAVAARPVIHLGLSPEEVMKIIGHPDNVEAIKTPAGKGERWTYKRLEKEWTDQIAATVDVVPAFVGEVMPNQGIGDVEVPHNHLEHVKLYQVSTLVFVGGKLVAVTQQPKKESQIEN
ncbi:MAG TPA: hypothetical protein VG710_02195 [Opitutus sp.]|nr:hypothetical protein [Opitutus sp.]